MAQSNSLTHASPRGPSSLSTTFTDPDAPVPPIAERLQDMAQQIHDLQNFLNAIRLIGTLLGQSASDERELKNYLATLDETTLHAAEICTQLQAGLDVCRQSASASTMIDLSQLLRGMKHLFEISVRENVTVEMELDDGVPPVSANSTELRQVVLDLFSNAVDALTNGKGTIGFRTGVSDANDWHDMDAAMRVSDGVVDDRPSVYLEVRDTGCGMDRETLRQMFQSSFSTKPHGHGLGMASVSRIVQKHHGAVFVCSQLGVGTRVRCHFPAD